MAAYEVALASLTISYVRTTAHASLHLKANFAEVYLHVTVERPEDLLRSKSSKVSSANTGVSLAFCGLGDGVA